MTERVAFIGGGNMGRAILGGLVERGYPRAALVVADPLAATRDALAKDFGVTTTADNAQAADGADVVVLAVKPQQMREVVTGLASILAIRRPLLLSIAAGITTESLRRWAGVNLPLVRAMPNTPALIGRGATALYATPDTPPAARALTDALLAATGLVLWVEGEAALDAVTALSGSGPAYVFLLIECLERAGAELGLAPETARQLALATASGAAELATRATVDAATLRAQVTSKGGTTERALEVFREGGFAPLVSRALEAAGARAAELSREFGKA